ncbi:hypothetical protein MBLNU457_1757t2 [Dothideomycetes sp. NU457]
MDALLEQARSVYEGQIDFEGQRFAEFLCNLLLTSVGVSLPLESAILEVPSNKTDQAVQFFAFIIGFITQNITYTLWTGLGGTAITFLVVVPPWPFFNSNPVRWLPAKKGSSNYDITVDGKKVE